MSECVRGDEVKIHSFNLHVFVVDVQKFSQNLLNVHQRHVEDGICLPTLAISGLSIRVCTR